jgi:hypothetical protein
MNPGKTGKIISRYESGLLSAAEVATSLLYDLLSESGIDSAFLASVDSLPDEVRHEFFHLLRSIQEADFHWAPFLLATSMVPPNSAEHPEKLRQIWAILGETRRKEVGSRS